MPADHPQKDEERLRKLADRTRMGWAETHPLTEDELQAIRGVVQEQWEYEQQVKARVQEARQAAQDELKAQNRLELSEEEKQRQAQEEEQRRKDQSHGHGHGH